MASVQDWINLATRLNAQKTARNSAPGHPGTSVANALTAGTAEAIADSLGALLNDIDKKDSTTYGLPLRDGAPEGKYYTTANIQIKILEKKIIPSTSCTSHSTCVPYTVVSCKPNTQVCGHSGCTANAPTTCKCQSAECSYCANQGPPCAYCYCDGDSSCTCDKVCTCNIDCGHSCCDTVCSPYSSCSSNCPSHVSCPSNCGCYNVCGCVFV